MAGDAGKIRIGNVGQQTSAYLAGISGSVVAGGVAVVINTSGQLGTVVSSARYKEAIEPMAQASETILALKPVTFRYKKEYDPAGIPQFGLVAEQVEKVDPDLVARDEKGKPYTVRYEAVNAMLLNEFIEAHRTIEEQATQLSEQQVAIDEMRTALKRQAAQLQAVSNRLESSLPIPRIVASED